MRQEPPSADPAGCRTCGSRPEGVGPVLTCPGCGAGSEYIATAVAARTLREGAQSRACTACELVTIVVEPGMVCPDCERLPPQVNDLLRSRFARLGPGDPADAPCVGCGHYISRPTPPSPPLDLVVDCQGCTARIAIPVDEFRVGQGMQLFCGRCDSRTVIPPTIWCPKCGQHLRRAGIAELIVDATLDSP